MISKNDLNIGEQVLVISKNVYHENLFKLEVFEVFAIADEHCAAKRIHDGFNEEPVLLYFEEEGKPVPSFYGMYTWSLLKNIKESLLAFANYLESELRNEEVKIKEKRDYIFKMFDGIKNIVDKLER